jgi:hypothetical protein
MKGYLMKRCLLLTATILLISSLGCQRTQDTGNPAKNTISRQSPFTVSTDFSQLTDQIPLLFDNLGITLVNKIEKTGSCEYIGKSLSGHTVRVEATALVKGETAICTIVEGELGVGNILRKKIDTSVRDILSKPSNR